MANRHFGRPRGRYGDPGETRFLVASLNSGKAMGRCLILVATRVTLPSDFRRSKFGDTNLRLCTVAVLVLAGGAVLFGQTVVYNFEQFASNTNLTTQLPGLSFQHATILTQGVSLNAAYPPHSGVNVVFDNGGALSFTITFASPVNNVGGYFTYSTRLTMAAFDAGNNQVASTSSLFTSNVIGNSVGGTPNEFIQVASAGGIAKVVITGNPTGNSFTLDDLTIGTTGVPTLSFPAMAAMALILAAAGVLLLKRQAGHKAV